MKKLLLLLLLITPYQLTAETPATSGNLLPNAGQNSTPSLHNSNPHPSGYDIPDNISGTGDNKDLSVGDTTNLGFTVESGSGREWGGGGSLDIEANASLRIGASGSLENITVTGSDGTTYTTDGDMLDNGLQLDAITHVQNCEHSSSQWRCGSWQGSTDTFSTRVYIKDDSGSILASVNQTRNADAGWYGNTHIYKDTVIHNGTGARNWEWDWSGFDQSGTNGSLLGPNILGASLTMTLNDITTTPPISEEELTTINTAVAGIETVSSELEELKIEEEIKVEELELEQPTISTEIKIEEELMIEEIKELEEVKVTEVEMEVFKELFVENFTAILEEENLVEEFEEILMEEAITEEEFFEETISMVVETLEEPTESLNTEEPKTEMKEPEAMEEEVVQSEEPVATENNSIETSSGPTMEENKPTEEVSSSENETVSTEENANEEVATENEQPTTEENNTNATETTAQSEETSNEGDTETETETVSNESSMDEDTTSEGTPTQEDGEETVVAEDTSVSESTTEAESIGAKIEKIIAKVEAKLKKVSDRVRAVQVVTLKGMQTDGPNLSSYSKPIYQNQRMIGVPNPDFFQTINILEQQQIYADASLVAYTGNDPIAVKQGVLREIHNEKLRVLQELKELKRGS